MHFLEWKVWISIRIAEDASPHHHAENSLVQVKDTHLMNNKMPPAEILCGEWINDPYFQYQPKVSQDACLVQIWWF